MTVKAELALIQGDLSTNHEQVAHDLMTEYGFSTWPGQLAMQFAVVQAHIIRPLLRKPVEELRAEGWLTPMEGDVYNPERPIDAIGPVVLDHLLPSTLMDRPHHLFVEETGLWVENNMDRSGPHVFVTVDPVDGTNNIDTGHPYVASGMVILDEEGKLLGGSVVSLTGSELLVVDQTPRIYEYDDIRGHLTEIIMQTKPAYGPLRAAILGRRLEDERIKDLVKKGILVVEHPTFGGWGLIELISGKIDLMIDPFVGQYWYEAVTWGALAQAFGLKVVFHYNGQPITLGEIIEMSRTFKNKEDIKKHRIQVTIRRDEDILHRMLNFN